MWEPLGVGRVSRGPLCSAEGIQLTDGLDQIAATCVENIIGRGAPRVSCEVRSQTAHRHVLRVASVALTSGVHVSGEPQAQKITRKSVHHLFVEGLSRDDPLAGAPAFHDRLTEDE